MLGDCKGQEETTVLVTSKSKFIEFSRGTRFQWPAVAQ